MTFIVKDLDKSAKMFRSLFEAEEVYSSDKKNFSISREKFFLIGKLWVALMEGDSLKEKTYNHIAFKVSKESLPTYLDKIEEFGLEIKDGRSRIKEESESVYFYDYYNHLFELHTGTLRKRLKRYVIEG